MPGIKKLQVDGDLILGGLFPVHKRSKFTENKCGEIDFQPGFQYLAAMLFALQQVNNNSKLLPNITLGATFYDTCRSQTIGADRAKDIIKYSLIEHKKPLVGVVGPFTSDVSIAVANLLRVFEIPQVSYGSTSAELSNKDLYGNFFRTVPPDLFQAQALVDVIKHYEWNYIHTIHSHGHYGEKGMEMFSKFARESGICIAKAASLPLLPDDNSYKNVLERLVRHKEGQAHVIVLFTTQPDSAGLLQAAKELDVRDFTWLGSSGWSNRIDVTEGKEEVANGSLTVGHLEGDVNGFLEFLTNLNRTTLPFKTNEAHNQWLDEVLQSVLKCEIANVSPPNSPDVCSVVASLPRDVELAPVRVVVNAVYAIAYALSDMHRDLCLGKIGLCDSMREKLQGKFITYLKNVTFPDAAFNSSVSFNVNQEMDGAYSIINFREGEQDEWKYFVVGSWKSFKSSQHGQLKINDSLVSWGIMPSRPPQSYCSNACSSTEILKRKSVNRHCCWDCKRCKAYQVIVNNTCRTCNMGYIPDKSLSRCTKLTISNPEWTDPALTSLAVVSGVWILVTIGTFVFYVINREHSVIKAAGRELSLLIFIGVMLCFSSSFSCMTKPTDLVCTIHRYLESLCFTMVYAPLLIKTNRIYRIFTRARRTIAKPPLIRPKSQILISLGLVTVQLMITTVWIISDSPTAIIKYPSLDKAELICSESILNVLVDKCYNIILMFLCTVFAFKTRNYPRNFNEAKHIGITMYITCSIWIIFIPTYFNLNDSEWRVIVGCTLFIVAGSVNLVGLLLPKVVIIVSAKASQETVHVSAESAEERGELTISTLRDASTMFSRYNATSGEMQEEILSKNFREQIQAGPLTQK